MDDFRPLSVPVWSFPIDFPSPAGMEHVHEDETPNREVYDALSALEHEEESPLEEATFETLVSTLPLGYSRAITAGLNGMWGLDVSGGSDERLGDTSVDTGGALVATIRDDTSLCVKLSFRGGFSRCSTVPYPVQGILVIITPENL